MTSKVKNIILWVLSILLALGFFMAGGSKLAGGMTEQFVNWGFPSFMAYIIGALEVLGAIGLLVPKFRKLAAMGLIAIMIGAVGTHLKAGDAITSTIPAIVNALWAGAIILISRLKTKD